MSVKLRLTLFCVISFLSYMPNINGFSTFHKLIRYSSRTILQVASDSKQKLPDTNAGTNSAEIADVVKLVVSAIEEGRTKDLEDAGISVKKLSVQETILKNAKDSEVRAQVLGNQDDEDLEIYNALNQSLNNEMNQSADVGYDESDFESIENFAEIKEEVEKTINQLRDQGSGMGKLLEYESSYDSSYLWGPPMGKELILTPLPASSIPVAPPSLPPGATMEVEELEGTDLSENDLRDVDLDSTAAPLSTSEPAQPPLEDTANGHTNAIVNANEPSLSPAPETQLQFEQLLKVAMKAAEASAGTQRIYLS